MTDKNERDFLAEIRKAKLKHSTIREYENFGYRIRSVDEDVANRTATFFTVWTYLLLGLSDFNEADAVLDKYIDAGQVKEFREAILGVIREGFPLFLGMTENP